MAATRLAPSGVRIEGEIRRLRMHDRTLEQSEKALVFLLGRGIGAQMRSDQLDRLRDDSKRTRAWRNVASDAQRRSACTGE
jgi:hypothetical protein